MSEIEQMLNNRKQELDQIEVPEEMEARLSDALTKRADKKINRSWKKLIAVACLTVLLAGYNFDALAFYGKKLIGYDQVLNGTLKQLNELGKGQLIGKTHTFKNGTSVILDGVMLDDNQLLAFYTAKDPKGKVDDIGLRVSLKGFLKEYFMSGHGVMNDEKTEIKWVASFEPPLFLEKTFDLQMVLNEGNKSETGQITFKLDRSKAMGYTLKQRLNKTIEIDGSSIHFDTISASPTSTAVNGSIQNIVELAKDQLTGERIRPGALKLRLIANGKEVASQSGGMSTDLKGITFHQEFDALPSDLTSLNIKLESFAADHDINQEINLQKTLHDLEVDIEGQSIVINKLHESNGDTYITITTKDTTVLKRVHLIMDQNRVDLEETINNSYNKLVNDGVMHTRTLHFKGTGETYRLDLERMTYKKVYNKTINITLK